MPDIGILHSHALSSLTSDQLLEKVSDFLNTDDWNMSKLVSFLPLNIVHRIMSIHAGRGQSGQDRVIWGLSNNGDFTVKTAYESNFKNNVSSPWK